MNNTKSITEITRRELDLGVAEPGKSSWHDEYRGSAYVFVGGLSYDLTEGDVLSFMSQYGEIVNINLVRDKKTGKSKGFCFVGYEDQRGSILAVDNLNGIKLSGRTIRVDHVKEYRRPKDDQGNEIMETGCAPRTPTPSPTPSLSPEPIKVKKKKKEKKKKKKKEIDAKILRHESDRKKSSSSSVDMKRERNEEEGLVRSGDRWRGMKKGWDNSGWGRQDNFSPRRKERLGSSSPNRKKRRGSSSPKRRERWGSSSPKRRKRQDISSPRAKPTSNQSAKERWDSFSPKRRKKQNSSSPIRRKNSSLPKIIKEEREIGRRSRKDTSSFSSGSSRERSLDGGDRRITRTANDNQDLVRKDRYRTRSPTRRHYSPTSRRKL